MRLREEQRQKTKAELLAILVHGPRITGQMQGTPHFHGRRTLSLYQIRTLLRETGKVVERAYGIGMYTSTLWTLKPEVMEEIKKDIERHNNWQNEHEGHQHYMEACEKVLKK